MTSYSDEDDNEYQLYFGRALTDNISTARLSSNNLLIGYLVTDEDCPNPLEDNDGMGRIYNTHAHRSDFMESTNYSLSNGASYGTPHPLGVLLRVATDGYRIIGLTEQHKDRLADAEAVWMPESCCLEHIHSTAYLSFCPESSRIFYDCDNSKTNVITWELPDGRRQGGYKNFTTAAQGLVRKLGLKPARSKLRAARQEVALQCAGQAVEEYNKWASGDCYGVVIEEFDAQQQHVDLDACWGYIGYEYAVETLEETLCECVALTNKELADKAAALENNYYKGQRVRAIYLGD